MVINNIQNGFQQTFRKGHRVLNICPHIFTKMDILQSNILDESYIFTRPSLEYAQTLQKLNWCPLCILKNKTVLSWTLSKDELHIEASISLGNLDPHIINIDIWENEWNLWKSLLSLYDSCRQWLLHNIFSFIIFF